MNRIMLVVLLASIVMGCNTAYRSGQTPDDVYFSPAINSGGYVVVEEEERYNNDRTPMDERYLRMKTFGSRRWNMFDDDFGYWNNPQWNNRSHFDMMYGVGPMNGFSAFGNTLWRNPFSPVFYGQPLIVFNTFQPLRPKNNAPRTYNLNTYTPPRMTVDSKLGNRSYRTTGGQYYNNNGSPRGGYNSNSSGGSGSPNRTFSNSSNSGSSNRSSGSGSSGSSSSGSSGTAPVRSFPRGGN